MGTKRPKTKEIETETQQKRRVVESPVDAGLHEMARPQNNLRKEKGKSPQKTHPAVTKLGATNAFLARQAAAPCGCAIFSWSSHACVCVTKGSKPQGKKQCQKQTALIATPDKSVLRVEPPSFSQSFLGNWVPHGSHFLWSHLSYNHLKK